MILKIKYLDVTPESDPDKEAITVTYGSVVSFIIDGGSVNIVAYESDTLIEQSIPIVDVRDVDIWSATV